VLLSPGKTFASIGRKPGYDWLLPVAILIVMTVIGVSVVNPGPVASNFGEARGHPYDRDRPKPVAPAEVADAVVNAIEHDKRELYVPPWFRPAVVVRHLVPPMLRWGTKRSFRDELAADGATR